MTWISAEGPMIMVGSQPAAIR